MVRIKRVSIGSAFKIGAILSALLWLLSAVFFLFIPALLLVDFSTTAGTSVNGTSSVEFLQFSGASLIFVFLCGVPVYAIFGGLSAALTAFAYNLIAGWVGGLEIELERGLVSAVSSRSVDIPGSSSSPTYDGDKPKRERFDDPFNT